MLTLKIGHKILCFIIYLSILHPLNCMFSGVPYVAHFIAGHEHTQLSPVCSFISLVYSLLLKHLTIENLFIFIAASVVPCGSRKTSPHTSS